MSPLCLNVGPSVISKFIFTYLPTCLQGGQYTHFSTAEHENSFFFFGCFGFALNNHKFCFVFCYFSAGWSVVSEPWWAPKKSSSKIFWLTKKNWKMRRRSSRKKESTRCDTLPCVSSCSLSLGIALLWWIWGFFSCPHLNGSPRWVALPASSTEFLISLCGIIAIPSWTRVKRKFGMKKLKKKKEMGWLEGLGCSFAWGRI